MKRVPDFLGAKHVDIGRQLVVDPPAEDLGRHRRSNFEVRHLRERMHAGIGPTRSIQLEVALIRDYGDRPLDLALNRLRVLLNLPAAIACTGVLDCELESHAMVSTPNAQLPSPNETRWIETLGSWELVVGS